MPTPIFVRPRYELDDDFDDELDEDEDFDEDDEEGEDEDDGEEEEETWQVSEVGRSAKGRLFLDFGC